MKNVNQAVSRANKNENSDNNTAIQVIQEWNRYAGTGIKYLHINEDFDMYPDDYEEDPELENDDDAIMVIGTSPEEDEHRNNAHRDRTSKHYLKEPEVEEEEIPEYDDEEFEIMDDMPKKRASITFMSLLPGENS